MAKIYGELEKAQIENVSSDPGGTPPTGQIIFNTTSKTTKVYDGVRWVEAGEGGSAGINYITNGSAETNTTGWSTYADAAGVAPVDGEGGTATTTFTRSTSSPLRGDASFLITKDAASRQGEGAVYEWTIDPADASSSQKIYFDAKTSTNFADGDVRVYIIASNDNFVADFNVIETTPVELLAGTGFYSGYFQAYSATYTKYRLCFHVASTNATAYDIIIDNVKVAPCVASYAAPITDWKSYTPTNTQGFGTISSVDLRYRRVGDSIEVQGNFTSGTITAVEAQIGLPTGLTISSDYGSTSIVGYANRDIASLEYYVPLATAGDTFFNIGGQYFSANLNPFTLKNANEFISTGQKFGFYATVKIAGWGVTQQLSEAGDGRIVALNVTASSISVTTSPINFGTINTDTHGAYSAGTYTVPSTGYYNVAAAIRTTTLDDNALRININRGAGRVIEYNRISQSEYGFSVVANSVHLNKGDTVDISMAGSRTCDALNQFNYFTISKVQGSSQVLAGEKILARYSETASQSFANATTTIIKFDNLHFDTHNSVTTGASWKFTAPTSGYYDMYLNLRVDNASYSAGSSYRVFLYKNGVNTGIVAVRYGLVGSGDYSTLNCSDTIFLDKGDEINTLLQNGTGSTLTLNDSDTNYIIIKKV